MKIKNQIILLFYCLAVTSVCAYPFWKFKSIYNNIAGVKRVFLWESPELAKKLHLNYMTIDLNILTTEIIGITALCCFIMVLFNINKPRFPKIALTKRVNTWLLFFILITILGTAIVVFIGKNKQIGKLEKVPNKPAAASVEKNIPTPEIRPPKYDMAAISGKPRSSWTEGKEVFFTVRCWQIINLPPPKLQS